MLRLLALGLAVLSGLGCRATPSASGYLEWAVVVADDAPADQELPFWPRGKPKQTVRLGELEVFGVERPTLSTDSLGYPAITVVVSEEDRARLAAWAQGNAGRDVALLQDGHVLMVARVREALARDVLIAGLPADEIQRVWERLGGR